MTHTETTMTESTDTPSAFDFQSVYSFFETHIDESITAILNETDFSTADVKYYGRRIRDWEDNVTHRICYATVRVQLWGWYEVTVVGWANWSPRQMCKTTRVVTMPDGTQKVVTGQAPVQYDYDEGCNVALNNLKNGTTLRHFVILPRLRDIPDLSNTSPETVAAVGILESGYNADDVIKNSARPWCFIDRCGFMSTMHDQVEYFSNLS
jgi:hypothetical protein